MKIHEYREFPQSCRLFKAVSSYDHHYKCQDLMFSIAVYVNSSQNYWKLLTETI